MWLVSVHVCVRARERTDPMGFNLSLSRFRRSWQLINFPKWYLIAFVGCATVTVTLILATRLMTDSQPYVYNNGELGYLEKQSKFINEQKANINEQKAKAGKKQKQKADKKNC